ncbi:hypothetical protein [Sphingomonas sp.]|uniref:hypothetical protein n=1 Tax=Sphingomonas sp. TaxID=28214 RepID=UPI001B04836E|nr:hypothetical protein [Sphingomonas sp.]MBO9712826.1 hypothetical protein [Sphingomonas sp.]
MLAGLIFAVEDATDRPGTLAATLPFGGMTLLEYQVRLLHAAGADRVLVAVAKMTPLLMTSVQRAMRPGLHVEIVQSAEEAAELIPAQAHVIVLAEGLVTSEPVIARMAAEGGEALLVTADAASSSAIERLDKQVCWAGVARVTGEHLVEIAHMPADYDFQSALLRVAVQAHAAHVMLSQAWERSGHLVVLDAATLAERGATVLAALTERRPNWADRWIFTPLARRALPELTRRGVPSSAIVLGGGVFALVALGLIAWGWEGTGLTVTLLSVALFGVGAAMAAVMGETKRAHLLEAIVTALFGAAALSTGVSEELRTGSATPLVLALAAVACQVVAERSPVPHRRWWASGAAHLLVLAPFALAGQAVIGLAISALYAFATNAAAVEASREKA